MDRVWFCCGREAAQGVKRTLIRMAPITPITACTEEQLELGPAAAWGERNVPEGREEKRKKR